MACSNSRAESPERQEVDLTQTPDNLTSPDARDPAVRHARPAVPRRVVIPPDPHNRRHIWLMLVISLLVCLLPLVIDLGAADTTRTMEKITLLTSRETWQTSVSEGIEAAMLPTWNGRPRIAKPPLNVWMNMLAWSDLDPQTVNADTLVWRARIVGVIMALIALAATFWAGMSLGDVRVASLATMVTGTMLIFMRQGRIGSYDTHLLGWATLAVASGLWAMRPLKPTSRLGRRVLGWLFAGLALGAGTLCKDQIAVVVVVLPLLATIVLTRHRRIDNIIGLLFALGLGYLFYAPWFLFIQENVPDAVELIGRNLRAGRREFQPPWYYLGLFGLVFPWTVWLIGALFQPFVRAAGERRRQLLIAWLWFVVLFVFFSIPGAKQQRYIVPLLPAAGLMVAQVWSWHAQQASEGRQDTGVNVLRIPHWIMLLGGSIALPLMLVWDEPIVDWLNIQFQQWGWHAELDHLYFPDMPVALAALIGLVMLSLAVMGAYWHAQWKPTLAALATVLWMVVAGATGMSAYANSVSSQNEWRADAEDVAQLIGGHDVYYLVTDRAKDVEPNEEFLFYTGRVVPPLSPDDLDRTMRTTWPLYVIIRDFPANRQAMDERGFAHVRDFLDDDNPPGRRLYRLPTPMTLDTQP